MADRPFVRIIDHFRDGANLGRLGPAGEQRFEQGLIALLVKPYEHLEVTRTSGAILINSDSSDGLRKYIGGYSSTAGAKADNVVGKVLEKALIRATDALREKIELKDVEIAAFEHAKKDVGRTQVEVKGGVPKTIMVRRGSKPQDIPAGLEAAKNARAELERTLKQVETSIDVYAGKTASSKTPAVRAIRAVGRPRPVVSAAQEAERALERPARNNQTLAILALLAAAAAAGTYFLTRKEEKKEPLKEMRWDDPKKLKH